LALNLKLSFEGEDLLMYKASVKVPGSCGELAQGIINNEDFLITCPIDIYSQVSVEFDENIKGINVNIDAEKSIEAARILLSYLKMDETGLRIEIKSKLIRGRGMASSTADIIGVMSAIIFALGLSPDIKLMKKIALEIEPTDGIFLPGIYYFNHITGEKYYSLGQAPEIDILIFSEERTVNTLYFNKMKGLRDKKRQKEAKVKKAVKLIEKGLKNKDKYLLGKGVTLDSFAHQNIIYRPYLEKLHDIIQNNSNVYGINIAHSGTLNGLFIEPDYDAKELIKHIEKEIKEIYFLKRASLIKGGIFRTEGDNHESYSRWGYRGSEEKV